MAFSLNIARRLASLLVLLAAVSLASYLALALTGIPSNRPVMPSEVPSITLGDALAGYGGYVARLAQGDLGTTSRGELIGQLILRTFFKSLGLLALATGVAGLAGVAVGLLGQSRGRARAALPLAFSVGLLSMPSFLVGGLCQVVNVDLAVRAGVAPLPTVGFGWDQHLILPVLVLAAKPAAYVARVTSQSLEATLRQDYVRTAYAKGLTAQAVLVRHSLRAAAPSVLAGLALGMRLAIGALPLVEIVFVVPGMGFAFLSAVRGHEAEAASGLAVTLALTLWVLNAAFDLARRRLDPRLRAPAATGAAR